MYSKRNDVLMSVDFDEHLREVIFDVFSCLIPKDDCEDFKHETAFRYFNELNKVLLLEETEGDIWIIYYALMRMSEIKTFSSDFEFILDLRSFQKSLESNVQDLIMNNKDRFEGYLKNNGYNSDLDTQKSVDDAVDFVYSSSIKMFKEIQNNDIDVNDALKYIDILKDTILTMLSKKSLIIGSAIISGEGTKVGKKYYKGVKDYVEYTKSVPSMISSRFTDYLSAKRNTVSLTDLATFKSFQSDNTTKIAKLFNIGWEPLDEVFSICTGDLITLIGDEGVGKTNTAIHILMRNIMAGHDVLMMTGESSITKIIYMCLSNYIYNMTEYMFTWKELLNYLDESEEDQRLIEMWSEDFFTNPNIGRLHLVQSLNYEDFDVKIKEYLSRYPNISLIVIDHTDRLNSTGDLTDDGYLRDKKAKVDYLYKKEIQLKQQYDIALLNLAHSSSEAEKAGVKGKAMGVRIGATSSATTKDADFVFYLSKDPSLDDGFIKWSCKKVRDYDDGIRPFVLKRIFEVSELEYDVGYQLAAIEDDDVDIDDMY